MNQLNIISFCYFENLHFRKKLFDKKNPRVPVRELYSQSYEEKFL